MRCAAFLLLIMASGVFAADDFGLAAAMERKPGAGPIDHYETVAQFGMTMCGIAYLHASASAQTGAAGPDHRACISLYKDATRKLYEAASKTLKKKEAREALREHYVQASLALAGIDPQPDEIRLDYQRRQNANARKVSEAWARFDIER